jgi:hypothetical protein
MLVMVLAGVVLLGLADSPCCLVWENIAYYVLDRRKDALVSLVLSCRS